MREVKVGQKWAWDKDADDDEAFVITGLHSDGNVSITYDYSGLESNWHISSFDSDAVLIEDVPEKPELIEQDEPVDSVNHPSHYTSDPSGVECIQITRHRNFNIGNAIKYLWRAGLKEDASLDNLEKEIQDLEKAAFYIQDEIKLERGE